MLTTGNTAPSFSLTTDTGKIVDSKSLKGKRYVLYFYPKDDTPGCTKEACSFRDNLTAFNDLNVPVFGVSADDEKAHAKFVKKYSLNFPLLADPDHQLLEAYGVWVEKSMYGRSYFGVARSTFVIDASGKIEKVWEKVKPEDHGSEVVNYLTGGATASSKNSTAAKANVAPAAKASKNSATTQKTSTAKKASKTPTKKAIKAITQKAISAAAKKVAKPASKKTMAKKASKKTVTKKK